MGRKCRGTCERRSDTGGQARYRCGLRWCPICAIAFYFLRRCPCCGQALRRHGYKSSARDAAAPDTRLAIVPPRRRPMAPASDRVARAREACRRWYWRQSRASRRERVRRERERRHALRAAP